MSIGSSNQLLAVLREESVLSPAAPQVGGVAHTRIGVRRDEEKNCSEPRAGADASVTSSTPPRLHRLVAVA